MISWNPMRSTLQSRFILKRHDKDMEYYYVYDNITKMQDIPSLHYIIENDPEKPWLLDFKCECGNIVTLMKNIHTINENGIITPSVGHSSCGFHEWVKLENWNAKHSN